MQIDFSVERENSVTSNLWYGNITLRNGKDSITVQTDNRYQSANGAWNGIIDTFRGAIERAEKAAKGER